MEINSEDRTIKDIAEGATKGVLNWTKEFTKDQIRSLINKFRHKDIAFIQDIETISVVKEQLRSGEWDISSKYVKDKSLRLLIQMGLTLRKLENGKKFDKLLNLRGKILSKFGSRGLHIAQFVQNGMLTAYLGAVISKISNKNDLINQIEEILNNIDKFVVFIQEKDNSDRKVEEIKTRIYANNPATFMIFGKHSAIKIVKEIRAQLIELFKEHSIDSTNRDAGEYIVILQKKEEHF